MQKQKNLKLAQGLSTSKGCPRHAWLAACLGCWHIHWQHECMLCQLNLLLVCCQKGAYREQLMTVRI